jgi:hypothetical protein
MKIKIVLERNRDVDFSLKINRHLKSTRLAFSEEPLSGLEKTTLEASSLWH